MTERLDLGQAITVDWSDDWYHADTRYTSRSQLEILRRSPRLFHDLYVERSIDPEPPSPTMLRGTYLHLAVLEPDEWGRRLYPLKPERPKNADGRKRAGTPERDAYERWKDDCAEWSDALPDDALILTDDERAEIEAMAASVRAHPDLAQLLEGNGACEQTVLWRHADPDVLLRARIDWLGWWPEVTIVLDIKTTTDPSPEAFGRAVHRYGYHRQGAIYSDAAFALRPGIPVHFVFVAVRNKPPYETAVYELDPHALEIGRQQYRDAIADLVRRRRENDWRAPWERGIGELHMPGWAYQEE